MSEDEESKSELYEIHSGSGISGNAGLQLQRVREPEADDIPDWFSLLQKSMRLQTVPWKLSRSST